MQCFKWISRECSNGDLCRLALPNETPLLMNERGSVTLRSPGFESPTVTAVNKRYLCIYNVSLSCPAGSTVSLAAKAVTSPITDDTSCRDYLAIYTDNRGENIHQRRLCGHEITPNYRTQLPNSSFSVILWTDKRSNNNARFEFEATCNTATAAVTDPVPMEIGSGSINFLN